MVDNEERLLGVKQIYSIVSHFQVVLWHAVCNILNIITSAKEDMSWPACVCLYVCAGIGLGPKKLLNCESSR